MKTFPILSAALLSASATHGVTLIGVGTNNGSFETAPGADNTTTAGWSYASGSGFYSFNRGLGPDGSAQQGSTSFVRNGAVTYTITSDAIALAAPLAATDLFSFSAWGGVRADGNDQQVVTVSLSFDVGPDLVLGTANFVGSATTPDMWEQVSGSGIATPAANVGATQVQFIFAADATGSGTNPEDNTIQTYADNFQLDVVPEPSSALLSLAGVALLGLRRR